jgi:hypothetical protein
MGSRRYLCSFSAAARQSIQPTQQPRDSVKHHQTLSRCCVKSTKKMNDEDYDYEDDEVGDCYPTADLIEPLYLHNPLPVQEMASRLLRQSLKGFDDEFRDSLRMNPMLLDFFEFIIDPSISNDDKKLGLEDKGYGLAFLNLIQNSLKNRLRFALLQWSDICSLFGSGHVDDGDELLSRAEVEFDHIYGIVKKWKIQTFVSTRSEASTAYTVLMKCSTALKLKNPAKTKAETIELNKVTCKELFEALRECTEVRTPKVADLVFYFKSGYGEKDAVSYTEAYATILQPSRHGRQDDGAITHGHDESMMGPTRVPPSRHGRQDDGAITHGRDDLMMEGDDHTTLVPPSRGSRGTELETDLEKKRKYPPT